MWFRIRGLLAGMCVVWFAGCTNAPRTPMSRKEHFWDPGYSDAIWYKRGQASDERKLGLERCMRLRLSHDSFWELFSTVQGISGEPESVVVVEHIGFVGAGSALSHWWAVIVSQRAGCMAFAPLAGLPMVLDTGADPEDRVALVWGRAEAQEIGMKLSDFLSRALSDDRLVSGLLWPAPGDQYWFAEGDAWCLHVWHRSAGRAVSFLVGDASVREAIAKGTPASIESMPPPQKGDGGSKEDPWDPWTRSTPPNGGAFAATVLSTVVDMLRKEKPGR